MKKYHDVSLIIGGWFDEELVTPPASGGSVNITPTVGAITLAGVALTMNLGIAPLVGAITLTGQTTTAIRGTVITPTVGAITFAGVAPTLNLGIAPGAGAIVFTGQTPVQGFVRLPGAGAITFVGVAPTLNLGIAPGAGAIVFSGIAPVLTQSGPIVPAAGTITLAGIAPTLNLGVAPVAGAITLAGVAPAMVLGIAPGAGAIVLNGAAPGLTLGTVIAPNAGAITLTGVAPAVVQGTVINTTGAISLNGGAITGFPVVLGQDGSTWNFTSSGNISAGNGEAISSGGLAGYPGQPGLATQAWIRVGTGLTTASNVKICVYDAGGNLVAVSAPISVTSPGVKSGSINAMLTSQNYSLVMVPDTGVVFITFLTGSSGFASKQWTAAHFPYASPPTTLPSVDTSSGNQFAVWLTGAMPVMNLTIAPLAGAVTLTGNTPSVNGANSTVPSAGAVTLSGVVPIVGSLLTVPVGSIALAGVAGKLDIGIQPGTGAIAITGQQPLFGKVTLTPTAGVVTLQGYQPSQNSICMPPVATLALAGQKVLSGVFYAAPPPYLRAQRATMGVPPTTGFYLLPQKETEGT